MPSSLYPRAHSSSITSQEGSILQFLPSSPGAKTDLIEIIEGFDPDDADAEDLDGGILSIGDQDRYQEAVLRSKIHIKDGDIFQVVLARSARVRCSNPIGLYRRLRSINPSPYTYLSEFGELSIIGASPETLFSAYAGRLKVNPIAGTCPRGKTSDEDDELAKTMLNDDKERAEHVMLVDIRPPSHPDPPKKHTPEAAGHDVVVFCANAGLCPNRLTALFIAA